MAAKGPWFKNRMVGQGIIGTDKLTVAPVVPDFTLASEYQNTVSVTVQLKDPEGNNVEEAVDLLCSVRDANALAAVVGAFRLAETGTGAEVSATAKPSLIVTTSALGVAIITVTDVSTSFVGSVYLEVHPLNRFGSPGLVEVEFA